MSDQSSISGSLALLLFTGWTGAAARAASAAPPAVAGEAAGTAAGVEGYFEDATAASGLDFQHRNGRSGKLYFMEMMGSGGAFLDFDNDGDLDVFLAQGPPPGSSDPAFRAGDRLYRNDLEPRADGSRAPRFTDVTARSGIETIGYAMGVASGDYDNDGWIDLYVTSWGANQLWRNRGDQTFEDATEEAGARELRWSVPATFFDFDRDGWLDLFVGNYLDADLGNHKMCELISAIPTYCSPTLFAPVADRLWRNRGDGTFADVTAAMGLDREDGPALGAAAADFDGDGWLDLYVANDQTGNQMWMNRAGPTGRRFENEALLAGSALSGEGRPQASMGISVADFDGDGDEDIFLSHLAGETHALYVNDGRALFEDRTMEAGVGQPGLPYTGFGTAFLDLENDGDLDLLVVNGEVRTIERLHREGDPFPLRQRNQIFRNDGRGVYVDATRDGGPDFEVADVGRAALFGDVDNDGDTDVAVLTNGGPARLLLNRSGQSRSWLGLRLVTGKPERDALGARAELLGEGEGHRRMVRRSATDGSYGAANDPRVIFGLDAGSDQTRDVRVVWPSGRIEDWSGVPVRRYTTLREGEGLPR